MARFPAISGFILIYEYHDFLVSSLRQYLRPHFCTFDCWCADRDVSILRYCEDFSHVDEFACVHRQGFYSDRIASFDPVLLTASLDDRVV